MSEAIRYPTCRRLALAAVLMTAGGAGAEVAYPPELPGGKEAVTIAGAQLLARPGTLADGVDVAKAAPTVDAMYYPGQTYQAKCWSNWGDGVAVEGAYYSAIGDHEAPAGDAMVYVYDPAGRTLRLLTSLKKTLDRPAGQYSPSKIHSRVDLGSDGWLYYATHRGSTRVTTDEYHYTGDWILRHNPATGETEVVSHAPVGKQCIPCSVLDAERLIFYGATQAGDREDKRNMFFAFDVRKRKLLYKGYDGPSRYMMLARSTGRVYFVPGLAGTLRRYDPATPAEPPAELGIEMGIRAASKETGDGFIYAVSTRPDAVLSRLNTRTEKVRTLGPAAVGKKTYITSLDVDPTGRYLYYVPGAHGGSAVDGAAVVQYDVRERRRKVIAFLHPALEKATGYMVLGTFSTAVSPDGSKLYITWNGGLERDKRGRVSWDACMLTVVHIPESER